MIRWHNSFLYIMLLLSGVFVLSLFLGSLMGMSKTASTIHVEENVQPILKKEEYKQPTKPKTQLEKDLKTIKSRYNKIIIQQREIKEKLEKL